MNESQDHAVATSFEINGIVNTPEWAWAGDCGNCQVEQPLGSQELPPPWWATLSEVKGNRPAPGRVPVEDEMDARGRSVFHQRPDEDALPVRRHDVPLAVAALLGHRPA